MASATPDLRLPSQPQGITADWLVPNYTAWWQRHMCVNNLPRDAHDSRKAKLPTYWSQVQHLNHSATEPECRRISSAIWSKVGVAEVTWPNFEILGLPFYFRTNRAIHFKFDTDIETACARAISRLLSGRGLGHMTQLQNFGTLINFERIELSASNLVQRWNHKWPVKLAWLGSLDPIPKFWNRV